jgi:hypothetical protein
MIPEKCERFSVVTNAQRVCAEIMPKTRATFMPEIGSAVIGVAGRLLRPSALPEQPAECSDLELEAIAVAGQQLRRRRTKQRGDVIAALLTFVRT